MRLIKKVSSKVDKTIKYIFEVDKGVVVEYSYIDNGTGKDIVCTPTQTLCNQSCVFCHLTDHVGKIKTTNLTQMEIVEGIDYISSELNIGTGSRPLLISYMGAGEALANIDNVIDSMLFLMEKYDNIRFGLATMLPKTKWTEFCQMIQRVKENKIPLKLHLSLHFTDDKTRLKWMPSALDIESSLAGLNLYHSMTNNPIEVHYTIMDGVNDDDFSLAKLNDLVSNHTTIKLMKFSEKDSLDVKEIDKQKAQKVKDYLKSLNSERVVEYYEPPGESIGSSCGMFLTDVDLEKVEETVLN